MIHFAMVHRGGDVDRGDVDRLRLKAKILKFISGKVCVKARGGVFSVVRIPIGFAAQNPNSASGARDFCICG